MSLLYGGGLYHGGGLYVGLDTIAFGKIYVFGTSGKILSINDSNQVTTVVSPTTSNYIDAWFSSSLIGYAVTTNGKVVKTTNGGASWDLVSTITSPFDIRSIYAIDDNTVVVGGKSAATGSMIWRSTDGGVNWSTAYSIADTQPIECFSFINTLTGFCVDINRLIMTTDGGASWSLVSATPTFSDEISMVDAFNGWIGRESAGGSAYKTTGAAGGFSNVVTSGDTLGVDALSLTRAHMCGSAGYVYKTTNGTTWTANQISTPTDYLTCIHFSRENLAKGVVCGSENSIFITTNSGTTWTQITGITGYFNSAFIRNS